MKTLYVSKIPFETGPSIIQKVETWQYRGEWDPRKALEVAACCLNRGYHVQIFHANGKLWKDLYGPGS